MIFIENKKKSKKTLEKLYPQAEIIDLTSKGEQPFVQLSPFYPHGNIPVPNSTAIAFSVEGIWQGLKVFQGQDVDVSKFEIKNMKGIKRTVRKFGKPLGHRFGLNGNLIDYITARKQIYLKAYAWVLDNKVQEVIETLKLKADKNDLVFLDFETNGDIENTSKPLSHAAMVKRYLEKKYPEIAEKRFSSAITVVDKKKKAIKSIKNKNKGENQMKLL